MDGVDSVNIRIRGRYELFGFGQQTISQQGNNLNVTVHVSKAGIFCGQHFLVTRLKFRPDESRVIWVNGRNFKGEIECIKRSDNKLLVVNTLGLEDYIKGVLYHEVSHYWPKEVLKAQAIVSRTYAAYKIQENKDKDFHVSCDIYSQVYGGKTSERYRTSRAVDETRGEVIIFNGSLIPAYFHASCGGHTEDAGELWNTDIPALKGVVCNFCRESPHFRWYAVIPLKELAEKLGLSARILRIEVSSINASGRVRELKLVTEDKETRISGKDFRNRLGPGLIRSLRFRLKVEGNDAVFEGTGWGHGVGLCQWGAYFLAKEGYGYAEILRYYYPGCKIANKVR